MLILRSVILRSILFVFLLVPATLTQAQSANEFRETIAVLSDDDINEASGLALSRIHPGVLWTHNDSGDRARIFAIDTTGATVMTLYLKEQIARDWEDIAAGKIDDTPYIFVGEIGDNRKKSSYYMIHRIKEPEVISEGPQETSDYDFMIFEYEDGSQNSEALLFDEENQRLIIANKGDTKVSFYELPLQFGTPDTLKAEIVGEVELTKTIFGGMESQGAVGGDMRQDQLIIKSYDQIYSINVDDLGASTTLPYVIEAQGEAVAWSLDGTGYFTLSEERGGVPATIYYYSMDHEALGDWIEAQESSNQSIVFNDEPLDGQYSISITVESDQDLQVFISDKNGEPKKLIFEGEIQKSKASLLHFDSANLEPATYDLLIVGETFTWKKDLTVK